MYGDHRVKSPDDVGIHVAAIHELQALSEVASKPP